VLVVGAGVSGLTSALCLARRGFAVTVVADRFAPHVTSVVAGALWEWPPAVCGHHRDAGSLTRSKGWAEASYRIFGELAADARTGVFVRRVTFYFRRPLAEDAPQRAKMEELRPKVRGFRHDPGLVAENGVNPALGLRDAYSHLAPMIDTDAYVPWLLDEVRAAGCRVVEGTVAGPLRERWPGLLREYGAAAVVNCTGLGARELTGDDVYPLRGAVVRLVNDGRAAPRVAEAHCVSHDASAGGPGFVFIVPRGTDRLLLGGFAEEGEWGLDVGLDNYEPVREVYRRCVEFLPALRAAEVDAAEPVRVGLRPFRRGNVRLEVEPGTRVVHNYGHGGSGVTFSWGCAWEVAGLVGSLLDTGEGPG
jgi:D-amino-acid oxidase